MRGNEINLTGNDGNLSTFLSSVIMLYISFSFNLPKKISLERRAHVMHVLG